jgi:hypothetical protein
VRRLCPAEYMASSLILERSRRKKRPTSGTKSRRSLIPVCCRARARRAAIVGNAAGHRPSSQNLRARDASLARAAHPKPLNEATARGPARSGAVSSDSTEGRWRRCQRGACWRRTGCGRCVGAVSNGHCAPPSSAVTPVVSVSASVWVSSPAVGTDLRRLRGGNRSSASFAAASTRAAISRRSSRSFPPPGPTPCRSGDCAGLLGPWGT